MATPLIAGIMNNSGHFLSSSTAELAMIYAAARKNARNFAQPMTGYCGLQAEYAVAAGWNLCTGVGSPNGRANQ